MLPHHDRPANRILGSSEIFLRVMITFITLFRLFRGCKMGWFNSCAGLGVALGVFVLQTEQEKKLGACSKVLP